MGRQKERRPNKREPQITSRRTRNQIIRTSSTHPWARFILINAAVGSLETAVQFVGHFARSAQRWHAVAEADRHIKGSFLRASNPKNICHFTRRWWKSWRMWSSKQNNVRICHLAERLHGTPGDKWIFRGSSLAVHLHAQRKRYDIRFLVHGDDLLVLANHEGHAFVDQALKKRYEFKCDGHIGPEQEKQNVCLEPLGKVPSGYWTGHIVTYAADPRHAEALIRELHLENAKPAKTPGEKKKHSEVTKTLELPPLDEGIRKYRSLTMRATFRAQDRPDIAETTKCLARHMKAPNEAAFNDLKRLVRYLRDRPRLVFEYWPQRYQRELTTFCDSNHAGCLITRRSTTGLITVLGAHNIKHSSNIQSTISLSSGESEYSPLSRLQLYLSRHRPWWQTGDSLSVSKSNLIRLLREAHGRDKA